MHLEDARKECRDVVFQYDQVNTLECDHDNQVIKVGIEPGEPVPDLPDKIHGFPVEIHEEHVEATAENEGKYRPACSSAQIARASQDSFGTSGFLLEDGDGNGYITTNQHVAGDEGYLIEMPNGGEHLLIGDVVWSKRGGTVDLVYIRPEHTRICNYLYGLQAPVRGDIYRPSVGDEIIMDAANSGTQYDTVDNTSVDVQIDGYVHHDIIATENDVAIGGDSGAPWVYEDRYGRYRPVGMHFGSGERCFLMKADNIEEETGLEIVTGDTQYFDTENRIQLPDTGVDPTSGEQALRKGLEVNGRCDYSVEVTGEIAREPVNARRYTKTDTYYAPDDTTDRYGYNWYFHGEIEQITYSGEQPDVYVNGESINPTFQEEADSDMEFNQTIHLNEDYGLSEGDDAAALVDEHLESGVQVLISPGEYDWNSNPLYGGTYNNARLASDTEGELVTFNHGDGFEFVTYFDCSEGIFEIQDIEFTGKSVYSSPDNYFACWASSPDATIRLKNVRRPDGCYQGDDGTGFYVRGEHEGTIKFIDCQAHNFTDNGLYASSPGDPSSSSARGGRVEVIRGYYTNNNISNVRLAGDYYAEGVVAVHDEHANTNEGSNTSSHSQRNLWLRDTDESQIDTNKSLSGEIVNCDIAQLVDFSNTSGAEGVAVMMQHRSGSETEGLLKDCRVINDEEAYPAVHDAFSNSDWSVAGLHVTGSGDLSTSGHNTSCTGNGCDEARTEPRSPPSSPDPEPEPGGYESAVEPSNTVHLGEEGLSEGDVIDDYLNTYLADDTEVIIPEGRYEWHNNAVQSDRYDNTVLRGEGVNNRAILEQPDGDAFEFRVTAEGQGFRLAHVEFHGEAAGLGSIGVEAESGSVWECHNVRRPDGGQQGTKATGIFVYGDHAGRAEFYDCHIYNFPDNGLYASAFADPNQSSSLGHGEVDVRRGLYQNNNISNVRLGGNARAEQVVSVHNEHANSTGSTNTDSHWQRGIWLRDTDQSHESIELVDCHAANVTNFDNISGARGTPVVIRHRSGSSTEGHMENCRITNNDTNFGAIDADGGSISWSADGLHVTGDGDLSTDAVSASCTGSGCDSARRSPFSPPSGGSGGDEPRERPDYDEIAEPIPTQVINLGNTDLSPGDTIDPYLENYWESGTELIIPEGAYTFSGSGFGGSYSDAILRGQGEVEFELDNVGSPFIRAASGDVLIENITFRGYHDDGTFRCYAYDGYVLELRQVRRPDGGDQAGFRIPTSHAGTVILDNCEAQEFRNCGVHGSDPQDPTKNESGGIVIPRNGYYANCHPANIRLSGNMKTENVVSYQGTTSTGSGAHRALQFQDGINGLVDNFQCEMDKDYPPVYITETEGPAMGVIRDSNIYTDSSQPAVTVEGGEWETDNLHITGGGNHTTQTDDTDLCTGSRCNGPDISYTPEYPGGGSDPGDEPGDEGPLGDSNPNPSNTVHLGDEGLSEGDTIDPYLDSYLDDNTEVIIPEGSYQYGNGLSGEYYDTIVRSENGGQVELHTGGYSFSENIRANGGDVRICNLTFRDQMQERGTVRLYATDSSATIHGYRIWRPDGSVNRDQAGCEGFYIRSNHAGHLIMEDCQAEGFSDNGLYSSAFGDPAESDAAGGSIDVLGGRYANCRVAALRVAGDAYVEGATIVQEEGVRQGGSEGGWHRGLWLRDGGPHEVRDCDIYHTKTATDPPIKIQARDGSDSSGEMINCRIRNEGSSHAVDGSYSWSVRDTSVVGSGDLTIDPSTSNICRGSGCDEPTNEFRSFSGGEYDPTPTGPRRELLDNSQPPYLLGLISTANADTASYRFITQSEPVPIEDSWYESPAGNTVRSTSNFTIEQMSDGRWLVEGETANGYGDAYEITGAIDELEILTPDMMFAELGQRRYTSAQIVSIIDPEEPEPRGRQINENINGVRRTLYGITTRHE